MKKASQGSKKRSPNNKTPFTSSQKQNKAYRPQQGEKNGNQVGLIFNSKTPQPKWTPYKKQPAVYGFITQRMQTQIPI